MEAGGNNLFAYVSNSPNMMIDPLGLFEWDWGAALRGFGQGVVGGVVAAVVIAYAPVLAIPAAIYGAYGLYQTVRDWDCMSDAEKSGFWGGLAGGGLGGRYAWARRPVTVYRGVHAEHPDLPNALNGQAFPIGGHASPYLHNQGNNASVYTSWSTNRGVAETFANGSGPGGVVLQQRVPANQLIKSPDKFKEFEVLRPGPISGATPTKP